MQMMIGKRLMPRAYHHMGRMRGPERLRRALESLQGSIAGAVAKMPTRREFLRACCPAPEILGSR
jgi:tryptophan halogenase